MHIRVQWKPNNMMITNGQKKKNWLNQKGGRITAGQDQISLLKGGNHKYTIQWTGNS